MTVHPLGRHVEHDPRSRAFPATSLVSPAVRSVRWPHYGPVLDQGGLGACTGFALAQCLNTGPLHDRSRHLDAANAEELYSLATTLDGIAGHWPPTDTGSSGLAVAKAAVAKGYIRSYRHAFGLDHLLGALQFGPVIVGTDWREGMDTPDHDGTVHATGAVRGGHEWLALGVDLEHCYVIGLNSWGPSWGMGGAFRVQLADMRSLLAHDGDVTVPVR